MAQRFKSQNDSNALGGRIAAARLAAGLSVVEAGRKAQVHHSSIVRAEQGYFQTMSPCVRKICTALGVAWDVEAVPPDAAKLTAQFQRLLARSPSVADAISALLHELEATLDA